MSLPPLFGISIDPSSADPEEAFRRAQITDERGIICDEWAQVPLPPQSGLAVYDLAGPDRLRAARIYDDVEPPFQ
jgi:hypothetical protein